MDEDQVLKKITRLLEQGCTMLASHHECGAPLFRCKGRVVCPVCSFETGGEEGEGRLASLGDLPPGADSLGAAQSASEAERGPEGHGVAPPQQLERRIVEERLRLSLLRRLESLALGLEREQDLERLRRELDCIDGLLKVLRQLEDG